MKKLIILLTLLFITANVYAGGVKTLAVFNATTISGCVLWLDANDLNTITLNGSNVSQWDDKSGQGNHVTQDTAENQPAYNSSGMNGFATVDFDSSNMEFLNLPNDNMLDLPITIFLVLEIATQQDQVFISRQNSASNGGVMIREISNIQIQVIDAGSPFPTAYFTEPAINTPFMITAQSGSGNGQRCAIGKNGGSLTASADSLSGFTNSVSYDAKIGRRADGAQAYLDGKIAEIIIYDNEISGENTNIIEAYLVAKWGISI